MNHDKVCKKFAKWLKSDGLNNPFTEMDNRLRFTLITVDNHLMYNNEHPDVIGFSSLCNHSVVLEIKVSRADFLKDFNKPFRSNAYMGMGDFRYYCCPEGIISEDDLILFDNWGLITCKANRFTVVKESGYFAQKNNPAEKYLLGYYLRYTDKFAKNKI